MRSGYIYIGDNVFPSLFALSEAEQARGLMYQEPPAPVMSFIYPFPKVSHFWMKNTPCPLDIIFCCNGAINQICKGEPYSTTLIGDYIPSDMVVELPYGTAKDLNFKLGQEVGLIEPTKEELKKFLSIY